MVKKLFILPVTISEVSKDIKVYAHSEKDAQVLLWEQLIKFSILQTSFEDALKEASYENPPGLGIPESF